ncbi:MAG TPA: hypothetical protein VGL99_26070 [Chloroflexota bacterium]
MVRVTGWRALLVLLLAAAVAVAVVLALLWLALLLAALGVVLWLNVGIIPRLAWRLGVSRWVLDLIVLVALCAAGWLVSGANGATAGAVVWFIGIGGPRAVGLWLRSRVRSAAAGHGRVIDADPRDRRLVGP